jgi:hypothetical protein
MVVHHLNLFFRYILELAVGPRAASDHRTQGLRIRAIDIFIFLKPEDTVIKDMSASPPPLPFLHTIRNLKTVPRTGWVNCQVPNPGTQALLRLPNVESISDHMYRMAAIAMLMPLPSHIDRSRYFHLKYRLN